ncbi:MAG TPA: hypothetical protein VHL78_03265 [Actinomycetota bacterium]|nr:hypothetical protein [Actinomycetota bacterium]
MRLELEIGELTLLGFRPQDRHRIGDALRDELVRLLEARPPTAAPPASTERIDGGSFAASPHPDVVGRRIARAVHGGLG